jgi:hypothetical protein
MQHDIKEKDHTSKHEAKRRCTNCVTARNGFKHPTEQYASLMAKSVARLMRGSVDPQQPAATAAGWHM